MKTSRLVFLARSLLQLLDLGALAPDDDAGPRGANGDAQLVAGTVHFDRAHAGGLQPVAQRILQLQIFAQQLGVVRFGEPARAPGLGDAQPKSVRMYFLSHYSFSPLAAFSPTLTTMCAMRR